MEKVCRKVSVFVVHNVHKAQEQLAHIFSLLMPTVKSYCSKPPPLKQQPFSV
ncbi:MAG: hypothetical protein OJF50_001315 [Nitrospira sp.]|nr:hypothetical protein [Nitrospira sp.]